MTPLLAKVAKELTLPIKKRTFRDHVGLLQNLGEVHSFEITEVVEEAWRIGKNLLIKAFDGQSFPTFFLPADRTWIEWQLHGVRYGLYLRHSSFFGKGSITFAITARSQHGLHFETSNEWGAIPSVGIGIDPVDIIRFASPEVFVCGVRCPERYWLYTIVGALAIINTPKIIGRKTHVSNSALYRKLKTAPGVGGKYPLRAWTEIVLKATPPDAMYGEIEEGYFTGKKALHFVRRHLRMLPNGMLTTVSPHWRGDPALGIKRSRYRLEAAE